MGRLHAQDALGQAAWETRSQGHQQKLLRKKDGVGGRLMVGSCGLSNAPAEWQFDLRDQMSEQMPEQRNLNF